MTLPARPGCDAAERVLTPIVVSAAPVMIVTGATNGIGEAAAIQLAASGAHLGLVARSAARAKATVGRIQAATPGAPVDVFIGDLELMADVRKVATEILDRYARIDVL